jgi:hypothetical protein
LIVVVAAGCSFDPGAQPATGDAARDAAVDASVDAPPPDADPNARIASGLIGLWTFEEGGGATAHDTAGVAPAVDVQIADPAKVTWLGGGLRIDQPVIIASPPGLSRIDLRLRTTGALTVEAWAVSGKDDQNGTGGESARVVTLSVNGGARNLALGQRGKAWAGEVRTASTGLSGGPLLVAGTVGATMAHVVVTSDATNRRLYVDGVEVASDSLGGSLASWDAGYRVGFGAEPSLSNGWQGTLLLAAIYDRALSADEVAQNHRAGP